MISHKSLTNSVKEFFTKKTSSLTSPFSRPQSAASIFNRSQNSQSTSKSKSNSNRSSKVRFKKAKASEIESRIPRSWQQNFSVDNDEIIQNLVRKSGVDDTNTGNDDNNSKKKNGQNLFSDLKSRNFLPNISFLSNFANFEELETFMTNHNNNTDNY